MSACRVACALLLLPASVALAQPSGPGPGPSAGPIVDGQILFVGGTQVRVRSAWDPADGPAGRGSVEVVAAGGSIEIARRNPVLTASAPGDRAVLVAMVEGDPAAVEVALVPVEGGRPGPPRITRIPRVADADWTPVNVAATTAAHGFSVLWQEASLRDESAAWSTFEARFDAEGRLVGAARAFPAVPWPIADAAWTDGVYFLLLYYGTSGPEQTRLAAVHVDLDGRPREHPWWASRPGLLGEARLHVAGDRVRAVYRGGPDGRRLLEADVTGGAWAREVPLPRSHGRIGDDEAFGVRASPAGALEVVTAHP